MTGVKPEGENGFLDVVAFVDESAVLDYEAETQFSNKAYEIRMDVRSVKLEQRLVFIGNVDAVEKFGNFTLGLRPEDNAVIWIRTIDCLGVRAGDQAVEEFFRNEWLSLASDLAEIQDRAWRDEGRIPDSLILGELGFRHLAQQIDAFELLPCGRSAFEHMSLIG